MAIHSTLQAEDQHKRQVRYRMADEAAREYSALKSELDNYASYFSTAERKDIVKAIQALEQLMKIEGY